jgi:type IV pilus assembly protein PilB
VHSPENGGRPAERKIGEVLIEQGAISREQLDEALEVQKTNEKYVGRILVSLGYLGEEDLARGLGARFGTEYVALLEEQVDDEVLGIITENILVQHKALPLRVDGGKLVVAMSDPTDTLARSDLTISAGFPITPVVASEAAVLRRQRQLFGVDAGQGAVTERAGAMEAAPGVERLEPGAQPEVDLGEPAVGPRAAERPVPEEPVRARLRRGAKTGEILLSEGRITQEQLDQALSMQMRDGRDLGKILLALGFVLPSDIARALAVRLKLDYVVVFELSEDEVDPSVLSLFDEGTLRKYMALPLHVEEDRIVVAMSDPNDIYALENLRIIAKRQIRPVVATEEDLMGAFNVLFSASDDAPPPQEETAAEEPFSEYGVAAVEEISPEEPDGDAKPYGEEPLETELVGRMPMGDPAGIGTSLARIDDERGKKVAIGGGRIGDILLARGVISEDQLEQALLMQKDDPRELGQLLLSLGHIGKTDLARALAQRLRLEYMELSENDVDKGVASLVEQKVLRKHGVVPLRIENSRLVVAMSDPTNIFALEDLMMISGYPVTPVVALEEEIQRIHNKLFAMSEEVSEFLEEASKSSVEQDVGEIDLGIQAPPDEAPIIRLVSSILTQAVGDGASDIHIEPQAKEVAVRMRVDGVLRESMSIPPKLQAGVIARLKIVGDLDIAEKRVPQDGRFSVKLGGQRIDLRVASLPTVYGEKIVLRLLDTSNAQVELPKLGFPRKVYDKYEEIFRRPYGAVLVTGPTGSGKSTTLYATLNELNTPEKNIITVEDPVEYRMRGINQIQTNPKAGLTFASALKSILRADPDIVMIGEIRDHETAKIAVEAALTGHLVLATLHTNDAPGAMSRLTDMGVEPFLTSSAVDCVIAQRLARRLCDYCKEPVELEKEILAGLGFPFEHLPEGAPLDFHKAVGCPRCGASGYRGRVGLYELLEVNDAIKEMVLRRATASEIGHLAEETGMVRLRQDGLLKAAAGTTTIEEILRTVV